MSKNVDKWDKCTSGMMAKAKRGMTKAVIALEADTKLNTHVLSGALRRSWTHDVQTENDNVIGVVGSNMPYAVYEDNYHPNLTKALDENLDKYFRLIESYIKGDSENA